MHHHCRRARWRASTLRARTGGSARRAATGRQPTTRCSPHILDLMEKPEMGFVGRKCRRRSGARRALHGDPTGGLRYCRGSKNTTSAWMISVSIRMARPSSSSVPRTRTTTGTRVACKEYDNTDVTDQFRREIEEINQWLTSADLRFDRAGIPWPHLAFSHR